MTFLTYSGEAVINVMPDFRPGNEQVTVLQSYEMVGNLGYQYGESLDDYPRYRAQFQYTCRGSGEIQEFNDLFDDQVGRLNGLWFPSWMNDLQLTADITSGDSVINITDIDYTTYFPESPGTGRYIMLWASKNKHVVKKVTAVPSSTSLQVEGTIDVDITTSELKFASFLYRGRFDIDQMVWNYLTPVVAQTELFFIECPKEYSGEST